MKSAIITVLLTAAVSLAAPSDYVNFIRQTQQDSGVEWDVGVEAMGSMLSAEGVGLGGSVFELWSSHYMSGGEYLLDEKYVAAFSPEAQIEIITGDPYKRIARTRVDHPFSVTISVSGLVTIPATKTPHGQPAIPNSARQVRLEHTVSNYPEGRHSLAAKADAPGGQMRTSMLSGNRNFTLNYAVTTLTGSDLTKVEGEEVWTVYSTEDWTRTGKKRGGFSIDLGGEGVLASKKLQVWPIADATITGIDPAVRYSNLPPVTVTLKDLYPSSETMVRIYPGAPVADSANVTKIRESYINIYDVVPQDRTVVLSHLDEYFEMEGAYTMEVIHTTPFGPELLTQFYPIRVDRTIEVRGGIYTSD